MNLYLLSRIEGADYDQFDGFVIRAESEHQARSLAHDKEPFDEYSGQGVGPWMQPSKSTCELLTADGPAEIVLGSFNAG